MRRRSRPSQLGAFRAHARENLFNGFCQRIDIHGFHEKGIDAEFLGWGRMDDMTITVAGGRTFRMALSYNRFLTPSITLRTSTVQNMDMRLRHLLAGYRSDRDQASLRRDFANTC